MLLIAAASLTTETDRAAFLSSAAGVFDMVHSKESPNSH
jgi:hypothetical protein